MIHKFILTLEARGPETIEIAWLIHDGELWHFLYTTDFMQDYCQTYTKISGFPRVEKAYRTDSFRKWPFFSTRVPPLKRADVKRRLTQKDIDPSDEVALLREFGEHSVTNPYKLIYHGQ